MKLLSHYIEQRMRMHPKAVNWSNHTVGDRLAYSYRSTEYGRETFPSDLHYHDYYEVVVFEEGDVRYVCEGRVYHPAPWDVILIPPGKFHNSATSSEKTRYTRHVFYLYPSALDAYGCGALTTFLRDAEGGTLLTFRSSEAKQRLAGLLRELREALEKSASPMEEALALSYIIQILYLLNGCSRSPEGEGSGLPESILAVKRYVDQNFHTISSVSEVAAHFFYSREYLSRLFRRHLDTTVSDYVMKRRIEKSESLIADGLPLLDVAYRVGFGSPSTFIRAFKSVTGITPSEYRRLRREMQTRR